MVQDTCAESGVDYIQRLALAQVESYQKQPIELIGHYQHERSVADDYRGRQILEVLQNADDAGEGFDGENRVLLRLTDSFLIAANTGQAFSRDGIRSGRQRRQSEASSPRAIHR